MANMVENATTGTASIRLTQQLSELCSVVGTVRTVPAMSRVVGVAGVLSAVGRHGHATLTAEYRASPTAPRICASSIGPPNTSPSSSRTDSSQYRHVTP